MRMYAETGESAQAGPGAGMCCGWGCGGGGRWKTGLLWLGLWGTAWWLGCTGGGRATGVAMGGGRILWRRMEGVLACDCGGGGGRWANWWWCCCCCGGGGDGVPAVSCCTMSRNWFLLML